MEKLPSIRKLDINDLHLYKEIRLELLKNEPSNFGSSFEEESMFEEQMWINRLTKKEIIAIGAFDDQLLVGIVLGVLNPRQKLKHVATLNSIYVSKEYRKLGLAKKMIDYAIELLKNLHVEIIKLSVVTTNEAAINLYNQMGFIKYGIEKKSIKWNDTYIDQALMMKEL